MTRHAAYVATLAAAATLWALPAHAAEPLGDVYACADVPGDAARLACFDAAVASLRSAQDEGELVAVSREEINEVRRDAFGFNLPSLPRLGGLFGGRDKADAPAASASDGARRVDLTPRGDKLTAPVVVPPETATPAAPQAAPQRTVAVAPPAPERIDRVEHAIVRTKSIAPNRLRFYLDNGQVWDQTDPRKLRIPRERDGRTNTVEIKRAALGSFLLRVNGEGVAVRVQRRR